MSPPARLLNPIILGVLMETSSSRRSRHSPMVIGGNSGDRNRYWNGQKGAKEAIPECPLLLLFRCWIPCRSHSCRTAGLAATSAKVAVRRLDKTPSRLRTGEQLSPAAAPTGAATSSRPDAAASGPPDVHQRRNQRRNLSRCHGQGCRAGNLQKFPSRPIVARGPLHSESSLVMAC